MTDDATETPVSRPRIEGERELQIFDATAELLVEVGYDRLTLDAVATAAKASKATLYRRWSGKAELVIDALANVKCFDGPPRVDTGSLREDLLGEACGEGGLAEEMPMAIIGSVIPALHRDPELFRVFHERLIAPKLAVAVDAFARARDRGEIGADADLSLLAQVLPAVCLYQMFVLGEPVTRERVAHVVDQVVLPACRDNAQTS